MVLKGRNPLKEAALTHSPALVTITTTVYIPELREYWAESLDVLKICLGSLVKNTPRPFDLFVFDNGSDASVRDYLMEMFQLGSISCLLLSSENIGKAAAVNRMFASAPGKYVVYTDSDVAFHPGWLEESIRVFDTFGKVGMVSGRPWRPMGEGDEYVYRRNAMLASRASGVLTKSGDLIPAQVLEAHAKSIGLPVPKVKLGACEDLLLMKNGVKAYGFGSHFQYLTSRDVIKEVGPLKVGTSGLSKAERSWDDRLAELGYLRLAIEKPLVYHMGNTLAGEEVELLQKLSQAPLEIKPANQNRPPDFLASFFALLIRLKWIKSILLRLQRSLFEALTYRSK